MSVAIVKYNAGNVESVRNALRRLGIEGIVTDDAEMLRRAGHVIFPGVGEASSAMKYLRARGLDDVIRSLTRPVLGICLGMQLLCSHSEENDTECLGVFPNSVRRFNDTAMKVPHIGWNTIKDLKSSIFDGVAKNSFAYFVHGYYVDPSADAAAFCEYDVRFAAAIQRDNFFAVQFHPEKSGNIGSRILENFLKL